MIRNMSGLHRAAYLLLGVLAIAWALAASGRGGGERALVALAGAVTVASGLSGF